MTLDPFHILQLAANESAGSPVSTLFLKQSTYFEFSSLSPAPDWLLCFQSGTEETFKHAAPLPCLPGSAQSRNQPCNSAQVRPRFTIHIAAMLHLTAFSLEAPWFITPIINIFFYLLTAQSGERVKHACARGAAGRRRTTHGLCCFVSDAGCGSVSWALGSPQADKTVIESHEGRQLLQNALPFAFSTYC